MLVQPKYINVLQNRGNNNMSLEQQIKKAFLAHKSEVKRRAKGALKYDYLVPAGPYEEQWDWDAFFIGMSLLSELPSEAVYLRNWALNYLKYTNAKTGFTPGLVTPKGRDMRLHHIKPFLAQGIYFASKNFNSFDWIKPHFAKLEKAITYRERTSWKKEYDLGCWYDSMESGADNNVAALEYPNRSVIAADLNAFLYREYKAMSKIARALGKTARAKHWAKRSAQLKRNINKHLWDAKDKTYYNIDTKTGEFIRCHTYSNIIPLWAGLASPKDGKSQIKRYVVNPKEMWAKWGIRTLTKTDPRYNNRNIIKPHSNWQGPVWPIANYLYLHALLNYGFTKQAKELADKIMTICLRDIKTSGGMHENYHADTGKPLAAPNFVSWNLLVGQMAHQARTGENPFAL